MRRIVKGSETLLREQSNYQRISRRMVAQSVTVVTYIRKVLGSNLDRKTGYYV
jgi:hypothetical protein